MKQLTPEQLEKAKAELDALEIGVIEEVGELVDDEVVFAQQLSPTEQMLMEHRDEHADAYVDRDTRRLVSELEAVAFANIADLYEGRQIFEQCGFDDEGEPEYQLMDRILLKDFTKLPREVTAAIKDIKIKRERSGDTVEIKMHDKLGSIDKLMRFHGAYARENEQKKSSVDSFLDSLLGAVNAQGLPVPNGVDSDV